jgi:hypothetical protein
VSSTQTTVALAERKGVAELAKRYFAGRWSALPLRPRDSRPLTPHWATPQPNLVPCQMLNIPQEPSSGIDGSPS